MPYTKKSNAIATRQVLLTLIPFVMLWLAYAELVKQSIWYFIPFSLVTSLFILRSFVLMHDCGHKAMFKSNGANDFFGFLFGVITGMPQAVWSKNHAFHHKTNGDWEQYGGVFNILSQDKYNQLTPKQKKNYWRFRQPLILIPAGFFYVLFFPRLNWILGNIQMIFTGKSKYWKSTEDYWHMTYNNLALLSVWAIMSYLMGPTEFFLMYVVSTSLSGSLGILLFTIQHNFENSYATDTARVNYYRAAIEGTSMLVLPKVLNWFTADIAYHHLHHLSVAIPNYRLAECHKDLEPLFTEVKRVNLGDLLSTFKYQLWCTEVEKIVPKTPATVS